VLRLMLLSCSPHCSSRSSTRRVTSLQLVLWFPPLCRCVEHSYPIVGYYGSFLNKLLRQNQANRVARGGTQGGLNCLTHVLPWCLPTPNNMEADGNGYGAITGRGPLGRRLE
jgi:hypothetical protein